MIHLFAIGAGLLIGLALGVPIYVFSKREQRDRRGLGGDFAGDGGAGFITHHHSGDVGHHSGGDFGGSDAGGSHGD